MKKNAVLIIAIVAVLGSAWAVEAALTPSLNIVLTSQEPFPAEPGSVIEIEIEIQNSGQGAAQGLTIVLVEKSPFHLVPGEESRKYFQLIGPGSSIKTTYKFIVDGDALTNDYTLEFLVTSATLSQKEEVSIDVQGNPQLIVDSLVSTPAALEAGGSADLLLSIKNVGTGKARNVLLNLNATPEIIPVFSSGTSFLGDILPGESKTALVSVNVDSGADQKTYIMTLDTSYQDESGAHIPSSVDLGIPVSGTVRLEILKIEHSSQREFVDVEIANKGTVEASSVEARLLVNGELVDIDYISQIKPTKKTTFNFPYPGPGEAILEILYTGPNLEDAVLVKNILIPGDSGASGSVPGTGLVILIVLGAAGVFGYRYVKKKKKSSSSS